MSNKTFQSQDGEPDKKRKRKVIKNIRLINNYVLVMYPMYRIMDILFDVFINFVFIKKIYNRKYRVGLFSNVNCFYNE